MGTGRWGTWGDEEIQWTQEGVEAGGGLVGGLCCVEFRNSKRYCLTEKKPITIKGLWKQAEFELNT